MSDEFPPASGETNFEEVAPPREGRGSARERPPVQRPIFFIALAFIAGLSIGRQFLLPPWISLGAAFVLAAWGAANLAIATRRRAPLAEGPSGYPLFAAILLLGWASSNRAIRVDARADALSGRFSVSALARVEGRVCEPPTVKDGSLRFVLDLASVAAAPIGSAEFPLKIRVSLSPPVDGRGTASHELTPPPQGARVAAWGTLRAPASRAFPGDFDQTAHLHGCGIGAVLTARGTGDIELLDPPRGWRAAALGCFDRLRARAIANLRASLAPDEAAIAAAFLLGDTTGLSQETYRDFQRTGLAHILSVSGLHTGLVLLMILLAARAAMLPPRWAAAVAIVGLVFYCALTGFRPPVLRSAVMGGFILFAWAIGRTSSTLAALAASAFVSLALDARNLVRIDWQLSYLCAATLAILAPAIYELVARPDDQDAADDSPPGAAARRRPAWLTRALVSWLWAPLAAVLAIQIGLLPLQLALFRQFSLVGIPAQIVMLPQAFLILAGSIALSLLGRVDWAAGSIGPAVGLLINLFGAIARGMSSLPRASFFVPPMPWWLLGAYAFAVVWGSHLLRGRGAMFAADRRQKFQTLFRVALFAAALVWTPIVARTAAPGLLEFYAIDVGQGDGLVLRLPDGKVGVIDGGRRWGKADPPVVRFCRALGISRLDFVMASHADADHIGGLVELVEQFEVALFIRGPDTSESGVYAELEETLRRRHVKVHLARASDRIAGLGDVQVHVINPAAGFDNNEASIVALVKWREFEALLTGDIGAAAESSMLRRGVACDIDVLKVAHHGSAGSSTGEFLDAFKPEIGIVSVGEKNSYGHPSPLALARLESRGIAVARTDQLGTLRVATNGRRIKVEHWGE